MEEKTMSEAFEDAEKGNGVLIVRNPVSRGQKAVEYLPTDPAIRARRYITQEDWRVWVNRARLIYGFDNNRIYRSVTEE